MARAYFRSQRSQSMAEFALIAPILLLLLFGMIDFGRAVYYYVTIEQAASEGGRVAVRNSAQLPSDTDVENAVKAKAIAVYLANPCRNGPVTNVLPPQNEGYIYITEPSPPATIETTQPLPMNAPGGENSAAAGGGCSAINPAANNVPLQVTIVYNFVPMTPLIQQATANQVRLKAAVVYRTEY
jgi:Flp pilus assembly protein TadG